MVKELAPYEFTERLSPIFEAISREVNIPFRPSAFYPIFRRMMEQRVARAWESDGVILGALFTPDVFNSRLRAWVYFWFAHPDARGTGRAIEVLDTFEQEAKKAGCEDIAISSHVKVSTEKTARIYEKRGYSVSETVFSKAI